MPHYDHLSRADKRTYNTAITRSHRRRIEVHLLTLDGTLVRTLTVRIIGGQVDVDVTAEPAIVLMLNFEDPSRSLNFEPDSAGEAPMHRRYMLRVVDSRQIIELNEWIDVDVFTGPLWDFDRTGRDVSVVAHSVERLAMGSVRRPRAWMRKHRKTTVIRELLAEAGAVNMTIPDLQATTPHGTTVGVHVPVPHHPTKHTVHQHKRPGFTLTRAETYLTVARQLAGSLNRYLYGDGTGSFDLRPYPNRPVYSFDRAQVSPVVVKRPGGQAPNVWRVTGGRPKGAKKRVMVEARLPAKHPLSAESLAWNGKPYLVLEAMENPHFKTRAECKTVAVRHRDRGANVVTDYSFDALPIPWLRPYDMVTVDTPSGRVSLLMRQWTLPLGPGADPMTVGSLGRAHRSRG